MKRIAISMAAVLILGVAAAFSVTGAPEDKSSDELKISVDNNNPWSNLDFNNGEDDFQFAIVTDRTGGRRPGVFARGVERINLLQPEFVMSIGDLIEGGTEDPGQWALEWSEFESIIDGMQMPFFFCAGNHDISNLPMSREWDRKFGRAYYHFVYRDAMFLVLNSEDPPREGPYHIGEEQRRWAADVLAANTDVKWTFVFLHKPTWTYSDADHVASGWTAIEDALGDRQYTVFAGHKHNYAKSIRNGREHYMLATTGGGSDLSGFANGRFDHFVWVTFRDGEPVIANVLLDGVESKNIRTLP